ncbi:diguanylate cyclase [Geotalea uraniireducens]|uniref:Diguanylate cyclase n=1 Tax=Geotalea uraniireducens TaxID=351604 RepID=A0ABM8EFF2_9BACT|nr:NifB/NifX family molybdenum-iron cluster-binding protein [Geotalea uraniireducens]BDV41122.1 diguanylate cyclase [Geotalea uraniireducens]
MKLCFPVTEDRGLESAVFKHFGSAQKFVLVDTETNEVASIINRDQLHVDGSCNPIKALAGNKVDAVIVGGIGAGALIMLNRSRIKVYSAQGTTVQENVSKFRDGSFRELIPGSCKHHDQGCAH